MNTTNSKNILEPSERQFNSYQSSFDNDKDKQQENQRMLNQLFDQKNNAMLNTLVEFMPIILKLNKQWTETKISLQDIKQDKLDNLLNILSSVQEMQVTTSKFTMKVMKYKLKYAQEQYEIEKSKYQDLRISQQQPNKPIKQQPAQQKQQIPVINSQKVNFLTSNKLANEYQLKAEAPHHQEMEQFTEKEGLDRIQKTTSIQHQNRKKDQCEIERSKCKDLKICQQQPNKSIKQNPELQKQQIPVINFQKANFITSNKLTNQNKVKAEDLHHQGMEQFTGKNGLEEYKENTSLQHYNQKMDLQLNTSNSEIREDGLVINSLEIEVVNNDFKLGQNNLPKALREVTSKSEATKRKMSIITVYPSLSSWMLNKPKSRSLSKIKWNTQKSKGLDQKIVRIKNILINKQTNNEQLFNLTQFWHNLLFYGSSLFIWGPLSLIISKICRKSCKKDDFKAKFNRMRKNPNHKSNRNSKTDCLCASYLYVFGLSILYDIRNSNHFPIEKIYFSMLMIFFYSFKNALIYDTQSLIDKNKLINSGFIKNKLKEFGYNKFQELIISNSVYHTSRQLMIDPLLFKLRFLKQLKKSMRDKIQLGTKSTKIIKLLECLKSDSSINYKKDAIQQLKSLKMQKFTYPYFDGQNIVKYLLRREYYKELKFSGKINFWINVYAICFLIYSIIQFLLYDFRSHDVGVYSQALFLYSLYKYILEIINKIRIKARCLNRTFSVFFLKKKDESSTRNEKLLNKLKKYTDQLTINYIDDYSLKSVANIQQNFLKLWAAEQLGMQVMVTFMILFNLLKGFELYNYYLNPESYGELFHLVLMFIISLTINCYIFYISALINSYFKKQVNTLQGLKDTIFEILTYANDYLGSGENINSSNPFTQMAVQKFRLKHTKMRVASRLRHVFNIKKKGEKDIVEISKEQLLENGKKQLVKLLKILKQQQEQNIFIKEQSSIRLFGMVITFQLLGQLATTAGGTLIGYLMENKDSII